MFKYFIMMGAAAWFFYMLVKNPRWIAVLLFTCIIADINFDLKGIPLNFRAFVTALLFARVLYDKTPVPGAQFLATGYSRYIIGFVFYVLLITFNNGLLDPGIVKEYFWTVICAYLGYYFYMREGNYKIFRLSFILAGFSCVGDLVWTYMQGTGLIVQRLYFNFTPAYQVFNHNFFGYVCSMAFVFLLADYLTDNKHNKYNLLMLPVMFLGILLSTSRSSVLIVVIVSVGVIARALLSAKTGKKAFRLIMVTISCLIIALSLFSILNTLFSLNSELMETITARLIDEPMAILNRAMGNNYKVEALDSMDWRAEASEIAYNTFMNIMEPGEQLLGVGHEGFMARNYGYMGIYDAHNGPLLLLIEFGVIGTIIYCSMLFSFFRRFWSLGVFSPMLIVLIWIILYITSHNRELTSIFAFLLTGTMEGQIQYQIARQHEPELEETASISGEYLET